MAIDVEFAKRTRLILLGAGLEGIRFAALLAKTRTPQHGAADLRELLDAWRARQWVDQFEVTMPSGQHSQIWRGTHLLYNEWPTVEGAILQLVLNPSISLDRQETPQM